MAFYTIAHHIKDNSLKHNQLTPEFFDYVFLGKGKPAEISDKTDIDVSLLRTMRDEFLYWYPNDQRHTAPSHISNHLSFAIFHHVAIFPKKHWIQCISLNEHVNMEGGKMSKSKGNVIPLVEIPKKYGADVYRMYVISAAEPGSLMDWRERDVPAVKNRLQQFMNIVKRFSDNEAKIFRKKDKPSKMTQWLLSKVNSIVKDCSEFLENFRLRDYAIYSTSEMTRAVNRYLQRADIPDEEVNGTMAYVSDIWVRLVAPMTPHVSEELWSILKGEGFVSFAPWPQADESLIDLSIEKALEVVQSTIGDIREITKLLKEKDAETAHLYVAPQWMFAAMDSISEGDVSLNIGDIMKHLMSQDRFRKHGKEVKSIVDRIAKENGLWTYSENAKAEMEVLEDSSDYMESELNTDVKIHSAEEPEYDPQNKARFALPGRVSIFLE
jgi:leucyl-tRNA synthetase